MNKSQSKHIAQRLLSLYLAITLTMPCLFYKHGKIFLAIGSTLAFAESKPAMISLMKVPSFKLLSLALLSLHIMMYALFTQAQLRQMTKIIPSVQTLMHMKLVCVSQMAIP